MSHSPPRFLQENPSLYSPIKQGPSCCPENLESSNENPSWTAEPLSLVCTLSHARALSPTRAISKQTSYVESSTSMDWNWDSKVTFICISQYSSCCVLSGLTHSRPQCYTKIIHFRVHNIIHPSSIYSADLSGWWGSWSQSQLTSGERRGYTLGRSSNHHRTNTKTNNHPHSRATQSIELIYISLEIINSTQKGGLDVCTQNLLALPTIRCWSSDEGCNL